MSSADASEEKKSEESELKTMRALKLATNFAKPASGRPKAVLGAMEHGRRLSPDTAKAVTVNFLERGHKEIDTALMYGAGGSERLLGSWKTALAPFSPLISTKAMPSAASHLHLSKESVPKQLHSSLERLDCDACDVYYLHLPDHSVAIEETLQCVDALYREGKFLRFGLSNYSSWQVSEIACICKMNGWVSPTVFQGMYNALTRGVEKELFPCLRAFGISFYAYNPLAGGMLTGKHSFADASTGDISEGRFRDAADGSSTWPKAYRERFWKKCYFEGVALVKEALADAYGTEEAVSVADASLRWLAHHSQLGESDAVIVGASAKSHFDTNLKALESGAPLKQSVVDAFDNAWMLCAGTTPDYFR